MSEHIFHPESGTIQWKLHFASPPEKVFQALSTAEGRKKYWAESAEEVDGKIHYVFFDGIENTGEIIESRAPDFFRVTYFSWDVSFDLKSDGKGGTDMTMSCAGVGENSLLEVTAGWVSWLMAMKGAVDFGIDLRNHDPQRTWFKGYADN